MIRITGDGRIIGYVLEETDTLQDVASTMNCTTIQLMELIEKLRKMEWDGKGELNDENKNETVRMVT